MWDLTLGYWKDAWIDGWTHKLVGGDTEGDITNYENVILLGNFNDEVEEKNLPNFISVHNLKTLIKQKTSFKNIENPTCIDLILTNSPQSF